MKDDVKVWIRNTQIPNAFVQQDIHVAIQTIKFHALRRGHYHIEQSRERSVTLDSIKNEAGILFQRNEYVLWRSEGMGQITKNPTDSDILYQLLCSLEMVFITSTMCLVMEE